MVLVYKMLKGKCIEKPIKGKNVRDETTKSKDSGFNFDSKTEGESKETRKKGRIRAKKRRIIVESEMSDFEIDSLEEKPIKKRKGKASGKKAQKRTLKRVAILISIMFWLSLRRRMMIIRELIVRTKKGRVTRLRIIWILWRS